jgi:hypothetical protein
MRNDSKGNIFMFLRDKDVIHRRTKINEIERLLRDKSKHYRFSINEVTGILNRAGITVCEETVRVWCKIGLLPSFKVSKKKTAKWWMMKCHLIELQRRMHMMSEALEEYRTTWKRKYIYRDEQLPDRDHLGRFKKKETYDHSHMIGHVR